jgi:subtilisin family serine protease
MYKTSGIIKAIIQLLIINALTLIPQKLSAENPTPGQVVVQIDWGIPIEPFLIEFGGISLDTIIDINTFLVGFPDSLPIDTVIQILLPQQGVLLVQPNFSFGVPEINQISQSFPDEFYPSFLKGESPPDFYEQPGSYALGLDSAHLLSTGTDVVVAVIDNGLDFTHPLFEGAVADTGYDFVGNDPMPTEVEGSMYGHGTFVAGLVLLTAPDCRIIPLRAFDENGMGNSFYVTKAIYWAIDHGVDIINMSFGMYQEDPVMSLAIQDAWQQNIVMVASVGNDSTAQPMYPAVLPEVMAVSAIDTLELVAWFSNYGSHVDVCAPGVNIYSCLAGQYDWGTWSGTSFSAPFASGVAALILEYIPSFNIDDIYETIRQSARTELDWGTVTPPDIYYGYGCVDAFEAVLAWRRGDADVSGQVNIADLTYIVDYLFSGGPPPAVSPLLADFTCDNQINIADISELVGYLFHGGASPWPCY